MSDSRLIVMTGATRGLGRAMTEGFLQRGHTVVGCGRSESHLADLRELASGKGRFSVVDVAEEAAVRDWAGEVLADFGPPDLLINNAALINRPAPLWEIGGEEFDRMTRVNINGVAHVIRYFVPAMVERQSGVIVNFSSGWGRSVSPEVAPYCATKFAMEGLTLALAEELPAGMAAVPLNPGVINTEMLQTCFGAGASSYPTPDRWAKSAVPFLLKLGPRDNGRSLTVS
jgi:NAD(P)-dependent dehydrogenase (short-subunit alcohol dehydrogenase family)